MSTASKLFNALLYFGAKDERIRAATDKAGYQSLFVLIMLSAGDLILHSLGLLEGIYGAMDFMVCLVAATLFMAVQSYRFNCSYLDSARQRKVARTVLIASGMAISAVGYIPLAKQQGPLYKMMADSPIMLWASPIVIGLAASFVIWFLMVAFDRIVHAKQSAKDPNDTE